MLFLTSPLPLKWEGEQGPPPGLPLSQGGGLPACRNDSAGREGGEITF